jgi:aspartate aminotransferase-like enzyme
VENIDVPWGQAVKPAQIEQALKKGDFRAVFVQAHETSTGVKHPIREIGEIVAQYPDTVLVVDAISALGVYDIPTDDWKLDVMVSGSQKALMLPPGLAFASVSDKAWKFIERSNLPKYYFNFQKEKKSLAKNTGAYTSAVSLILGLREVLARIKAEGLSPIFARQALLSRATKAAVAALGLTLYSRDGASEALTAISAPPGIDGQNVVKTLREKYKITIAGGQGEAKGKIFRIAHMGYMDQFDVITAISALELTLMDLGYPVKLGAGVKAAMEVLRTS